MAGDAETLTIALVMHGTTAVLTPRGVLDSRTYLSLRDAIIKTALDEPSSIVIDITGLSVPATSALAVFTSARWHIDRWRAVPLLLACPTAAGRDDIERNGVARYVPVYPSVDDALTAVTKKPTRPRRRRARTVLSADPASMSQARGFVADTLAEWSLPELIPPAFVIVTVFVENVLEHTDSAPGIRLEFDGSVLTVAVEDTSPHRADLSEDRESADRRPSGLRIMSALCRRWGSAVTPTGKVVWAQIGPENQL